MLAGWTIKSLLQLSTRTFFFSSWRNKATSFFNSYSDTHSMTVFMSVHSEGLAVVRRSRLGLGYQDYVMYFTSAGTSSKQSNYRYHTLYRRSFLTIFRSGQLDLRVWVIKLSRSVAKDEWCMLYMGNKRVLGTETSEKLFGDLTKIWSSLRNFHSQ